MEDKKLVKLTKQLISVLHKASNIYFDKDYTELAERHKFVGDDVTNRDIATQEYIIKSCKKLIPNLSIIGEEGSEKQNSQYELIIDPIDGTVNYKNNLPTFGSQICLKENGLPIISVLYLPKLKDTYYANKFGAFKNNKKISVKEDVDLKDVIICIGDFNSINIKIEQNNLVKLSENVKRIRMFGSSCYDSCALASGGAHAYIIYTDNIWDVLPGKFLMEMAGASYFHSNKNVHIFANQQTLDKLKKLLEL